jgi:mRNA interferase MazF
MKGGTMYEQRDIVLIPFPYSDLTGSKQRPALILSNSFLNKSSDRICCLITTNFKNEDILIEMNSFEEGKLPFKSWIRPYRLFTISNEIIKRKLCTLKPSFYKRVISDIKDYIELDSFNSIRS